MHRMFSVLCMTKAGHRHSEYYKEFIFAVAEFLICLKMISRAIRYGYSKD